MFCDLVWDSSAIVLQGLQGRLGIESHPRALMQAVDGAFSFTCKLWEMIVR